MFNSYDIVIIAQHVYWRIECTLGIYLLAF